VSDVMDDGPFFHGTKAALRDGAGLAAELAAGDAAPRVYAVEPTGAFEDDPNVTDWTRLAPEVLRGWRDRLAAISADNDAVIIN